MQDIKHLQLVNDGDDPLTLSVGQYARLTFPGTPTHHYSVASGLDDREIEFQIRRVPCGATTQRNHALLKLGDPVLIEGPFGSSYLREQHAGPILCVATSRIDAPSRNNE